MHLQGVERRRHHRFYVEIPVIILGNGAMLGGGKGLTRDISGAGIFFYTDCPLPQGLKFQFRVLMPAEVTHGASGRATCSARVTRTEEYPERGGIGVAAIIENISWN